MKAGSRNSAGFASVGGGNSIPSRRFSPELLNNVIGTGRAAFVPNVGVQGWSSNRVMFNDFFVRSERDTKSFLDELPKSQLRLLKREIGPNNSESITRAKQIEMIDAALRR